ncbi:MAG: DUF916 domain-containing protein [Bifidobacteriaceae bacterium]|jgi:hypothetical protein|nr:DUF916 domain-containing protein [Bifidobacteriaceae bacterium]
MPWPQAARRRPGALRAAATAGLLSLALACPQAAQAADGSQDGAEGSIRWAVVPAGPDGPDGRRWIELEAEPGQTVTEYLAVKNLSQVAVEFDLAAADGYLTSNGRYAILNQPEESVDAGTWIDLPASIAVPAGDVALVPFAISVPANAEPGDHPAGVAASIRSQGGEQSGASLGVVARVAFRVMTRVAGELLPGLALENFQASYQTSWHPLRAGRVKVGFDLVNTGNSRLSVTGAARAGGGQAAFPATPDEVIELLPGSRRHIDLVVGDVWPLFRAAVSLQALPVVPEVLEGAPPAVEPVEARLGLWAPPWPQLALLGGLALIVAGAVAGRRGSERRLRRRIEQAVAEDRARAKAAGAVPGPPAGGGAGQEGPA